ncbi:MAG: hypothetical protein ACI4NG_02630 [Candidatus Gallimonas sp.]
MKIKRAICLSLCMCTATFLAFSACGKDGTQEPEHEHVFSEKWAFDQTYHWHVATCEHADEVSEKAEHTLVNGVCSVCGAEIGGAVSVSASDCAEAFDAVRMILAGSAGANTMRAVTFGHTAVATVMNEESSGSGEPIGYFDLAIDETQLITYQSDLGNINAIAFTYFFSQILQKDDYVMSDEAFAYAAEQSGVATGKLQVVYDGNRLFGSMYMLPIGVPEGGLFTIVIDYDFNTKEVVGFEWLLRSVGGNSSYYFLYRDETGYTVSDDALAAVASYLDDRMSEYEPPAATDAPYDVVAEWTATNEYVNHIMRA